MILVELADSVDAEENVDPTPTLVAAMVEDSILRFCGGHPHTGVVVGVLSRRGFPLHAGSRSRAGVLSLLAYRAIVGRLDETAIQGAAAAGLYLSASILFDKVANSETDAELGLGSAQTLAVAITVLNCAAAVGVEAALRASTRDSFLSTVHETFRNCITACAGQFLDATLEARVDATTEEALEITALEAGGVGRLAAWLGASLATEDEDLVSSFGEFGYNLCTHMQLMDDIRDACPRAGPTRDLDQHKKTVPLVDF